MSLHRAPIPQPPSKASVLLCCAHRWEARPFVEELELKPLEGGPLPYAQYGAQDWTLLITGSGPTQAAVVVSSWLGAYLERTRASTRGLLSPPLVVANFGTCGAHPQTGWEPGQPVLLNRVLSPCGQKAIYPERHGRTPWPEGTCRTVLQPRARADAEHPELVDMEAYSVAAAGQTLLTGSHLLLGKVVLDRLGDETNLDPKRLAARIEKPYRDAAQDFLPQVRELVAFLAEDPRRRLAGLIESWSEQRLEQVLQKVRLTLTQQRRLLRSLQGAASRFQGLADFEEKTEDLRRLLANHQGESKHANRQTLQQLQDLLDATPL